MELLNVKGKVSKIISVLILITMFASFGITTLVSNAFADIQVVQPARTIGISAERQSGYTYDALGGTLWDFVEVNNGTADYSKAIYCLLGGPGFHQADMMTAQDVSQGPIPTQEYTDKVTVYTSNDQMDMNAARFLPWNCCCPEYYAMNWLLRTAYIPVGDNPSQERIALKTAQREQLFENAGITKAEVEEGVWEYVVTEDDIDIVTQLAIWYFTNRGSFDYRIDENTVIVRDTRYAVQVNQATGEFSVSIQMSGESTGNVKMNLDDCGRIAQFRQEDINKLLDHLIKKATFIGEKLYANPNEEATFTEEEISTYHLTTEDMLNPGLVTSATPTSPVELAGTPTFEKTSNGTFFGPYKLNRLNQTGCTIDASLVDENENAIPYTIYEDINGTKTVSNKTFAELVGGNDFYLLVNNSNSGKSFEGTATLKIRTNFVSKESNFWFVSGEPVGEQPLGITEEVPLYHDYEKSVTVAEFDLALRKFITAVNEVELKDASNSYTREPNIDLSTLQTDTTATYNHAKDPVSVNVGDVVTYGFKVYNEGRIAGYAKEITDHLPEYLTFISDANTPEGQFNASYGWVIDSTDTKLRTIKTTYLSKEVDTENILQPFTGSVLDSSNYVFVKCKVNENLKESMVLTNIAEITKATDADGNEINDRDSTCENINLPIDTDLPSYKGNDQNKDELDDQTYFYKGIEDDDDFEKISITIGKFDLALRKFITKVNDTIVSSRIPTWTEDLDENGNYVYVHPKDPVGVSTGDVVEYTIRIFNEGTVDGFAKTIKDDMPEGLEFLPENEINKEYKWTMLDEANTITTDITKAKYITTNYLSKEVSENNLIGAFTEESPLYKDVKVAFKVTEPNTSDRIIINTAEIAAHQDKNGNDVTDIDSVPNNNNLKEDDIDIEKIKVQYFDLSLKKWVTKSIVNYNGKETVTPTGHTGEENPESPAKVEIKKPQLKKVSVKFAFNIRITNEGQIAGYAKEIKDYVPEGLKFVKADNPKWEEVESNVITTDQLKDKLLQPGESAVVEVILTWINDANNMGQKTNYAEISKDYNEFNTPDIDSTPNNKKAGEDDIDEAPVLLTVKTGRAAVSLGGFIIAFSIVSSGIVLIRRFVI